MREKTFFFCRKTSCRLAHAAALVGVLASCQGSVGDDEADPAVAPKNGTVPTKPMATMPTGAGGAGPGSMTGLPPVTAMPPATAACQATADPGVTPFRRLSTVQYRNTVRDFLTATGVPTVATEVQGLLSSVPDDSASGETFKGLDGRLSSEHVQGYFNVAFAVADSVAADPKKLQAMASACAVAAALTPKCVDDFLATVGRRALRRTLSAEDVASYKQMTEGKTPTEAFRSLLVALLTAPRFLNHLEVDGTPAVPGRDDLLQLSAFEVASRLSYTFWQTTPDDVLLAAAADGSIATDAGYQKQLERVFQDKRTQDTIWSFWSEWLHLGTFTGFATDRPGFKALATGEGIGTAGKNHWADMVSEMRDLTELFTWKKKGTLAELLATDVSVTKSPDLAKLYKVAPWSGMGEYPKLTDGGRAGLLQRGAMLATALEQTNPFHRGALIRRSVLCDPLPQPDPNSLPPGSLDPPVLNAAETTRQRFMRKTDNPLCVGCHSTFNEIGFVMESFDALGRFRTSEKVFDEKNGKLLGELPIDVNGIAKVDTSDTGLVMGPVELNKKIVASKKVEACVARGYVQYGMGRALMPNSYDDCAVDDLTAELLKPGVGLAEVWKRLAMQPSFRRKKVGAQ